MTAWIVQHQSGFRLHNSKQIADVQIAIELAAFVFGQNSGLRSVGKLLQTRLIFITESEVEEISGCFGSQFLRLRFHQPRPDSCFPRASDHLRIQIPASVFTVRHRPAPKIHLPTWTVIPRHLRIRNTISFRPAEATSIIDQSHLQNAKPAQSSLEHKE
jgi:hypothetical protein